MTRVAITGAAGYLGQLLLRRLCQEPSVERILALDIRPIPAEDGRVAPVIHDVTRPMADLFVEHGIEVAAHMAYILNPTHNRRLERRVNVGGTENFFAAAHEAGLSTVLIASSATAYGAWPDNPPLLKETDPLRGKPGYSYVEDKIVQEHLTAQFMATHPRTRVITIRPSVVIGEHVDNFISRFYTRSLGITVRGTNPPTPLVHQDDVAEAMWSLLSEDAPSGAYNLDAPGPPPLQEAARMTSGRVLEVPAPALYVLAAVGWRLRLRVLTEAPPPMLDYLRYPWASDGSKVTRLTDFCYRYTAREALADFVGHNKRA